MEKLTLRIVQYISRNKESSGEELIIYQYGIQTGLEMIFCTAVAFGIAIFFHMVLEYLVFFGIFSIMRSYAGGVHLKSFWGCFFCSVIVQAGALYWIKNYAFSILVSWLVIGSCIGIIFIIAPVDNVNRILEKEERKYFRMILWKFIIGILALTLVFTIWGSKKYVSLIAVTMLIIGISAVLGLLKFHMESKKLAGETC